MKAAIKCSPFCHCAVFHLWLLQRNVLVSNIDSFYSTKIASILVILSILFGIFTIHNHRCLNRHNTNLLSLSYSVPRFDSINQSDSEKNDIADPYLMSETSVQHFAIKDYKSF